MNYPLYKKPKACYNTQAKSKRTGGSMDRASDSGSEGWGFESLPVYQTRQIRTFHQLVRGSDLLFIYENDRVDWKPTGWGNFAPSGGLFY